MTSLEQAPIERAEQSAENKLTTRIKEWESKKSKELVGPLVTFANLF